MDIRIIRGTHEIGGSAVEISTNNARIMFDFGEQLNDNPVSLDVEGVTKGKTTCDAIFFSHYHGDHLGLAYTVNEDIPLYLGKDAKAIYGMFVERTKAHSNINIDRVNSIKTYTANEPIQIKDIKITPYYVDHSAYDAYMFLIEADNKKILYTGDFRGHGYLSKGLEPTLKKYIGKVDTLIIEGTTLNRENEKVKTELDVQNEIKKVVDSNKYVFMICASTNIHRIAGAYQAVKKPGKYFLVLNEYQKNVLKYVQKEHAKDSELYNFEKITVYGDNLLDKIKRQGCLMIGGLKDEYKNIIEKFPDAKVIYSMWDGYLDEERFDSEINQKFKNDFDMIHIHSSGHADRKTLQKVIEITNPEKLIPIHTEAGEEYKKMIGEEKCIIANDGEVIKL